MLFSRSGELYSSLINDKLITPAFSYGYTIEKAFAYNSVGGEADNPRAVLDRILSYIEKLKLCGLDIGEFERAKRVMYAECVRMFDSTEGLGNAMFSAVSDGGEIFAEAECMQSVSFEDARRAFLSFAENGNITLSVISPL